MLDQTILSYLNDFKSHTPQIQQFAFHLAGYLAVISLALSMIFTLIKEQELNSLIAKIVQSVFYISFFYGMISLAPIWIPDLISSLMMIGAKTSGISSLSPDSIAGQGYYIFVKILKAAWDAGIWHAITAVSALIVAIIVLILYAFIAGELAIILVKCYTMIVVGPLVFALGILDITRPTVVNYFNKVLGLGFQLLAMYLILGVGIQQSNHWVDLIKGSAGSGVFDLAPLGQILIGLIIFYMLVKEIPPFVGQVSGATGLRNYSDQAVAGAITAGAAGAGAIASAGSAAGALGRGSAGALKDGFNMNIGGTSAAGQAGSTAEAFKGMSSAKGWGKAAQFGKGLAHAGATAGLGALGTSVKGTAAAFKKAGQASGLTKGSGSGGSSVMGGIAGGGMSNAMNNLSSGNSSAPSSPSSSGGDSGAGGSDSTASGQGEENE